MIKYYCDCCGKEIDRLYSSSYFYHIDKIIDGEMHINSEELGEPTSGKKICVDLCLKCYNSIMVSYVKKFRELKNGFSSLE